MNAVSWWERNVVEPGKLPSLVLFAAFVLTWLIVRAITRSIRAGTGHLHNVDAGGAHLHHSTPGIILMTVGAVMSVSVEPAAPWREISAAVIGIGASLVFDEFAMILHLTDDYWQVEGRQSVEAVGLVTACLALVAIGFSPFGVDDVGAAESSVRIGALGVVVITLAAVIVCVDKGKYRLSLIAVFLPPVAVVGAIRLARPTSRWDRRRFAHRPAERARAAARANAFDRRWNPMWRRIGDALAGPPDPAAAAAQPAEADASS